MNTGASARQGSSVAVTVIGLLTVLVGGWWMVTGIVVLAGWANMSAAEAGGWGPLLQVLGIFLAFLGVALFLSGVPAVLAGMGVLGRKAWARVLAFVVAALAILWGLMYLGNSDLTPGSIALGAGQVLYGVATMVVLAGAGAEFSRLPD